MVPPDGWDPVKFALEYRNGPFFPFWLRFGAVLFQCNSLSALFRNFNHALPLLCCSSSIRLGLTKLLFGLFLNKNHFHLRVHSMRDHSSILRTLSLKSTPKRLAVLEILAEEDTYISPEEIWRSLKERFSRIGLPTVYRILEELADGGVISKVIHPNRQLYYYFCRNRQHHHHFICLSCRKVADVEACGLERIEEQVRERMGGTVLSHILQVNGLCSACVERQESDDIEVAL